MLTCPSTAYPTYPKIHFRIMRTVNPLSELRINRKFQKYISIVTECLMRSLFTAFKDDEWCHFVVRIGSPIETSKWSFKKCDGSAFSNQHNWLGSVWEKFDLHLISTWLLELLTAKYLHEINISIFIFLYFYISIFLYFNIFIFQFLYFNISIFIIYQFLSIF